MSLLRSSHRMSWWFEFNRTRRSTTRWVEWIWMDFRLTYKQDWKVTWIFWWVLVWFLLFFFNLSAKKNVQYTLQGTWRFVHIPPFDGKFVLLKLKPGPHEKWGKQLTPETTNPLKKNEWDLSNNFFRGPFSDPVGDFLGGSSKLGGSSVDSLQLELMGTQPTRSIFECWRERVSPKPASSYSFSVREFWMIKGVCHHLQVCNIKTWVVCVSNQILQVIAIKCYINKPKPW